MAKKKRVNKRRKYDNKFYMLYRGRKTVATLENEGYRVRRTSGRTYIRKKGK